MKLQISLRRLEVCLLALLSASTVQAQVASQTAHRPATQVIAARLSSGPLDLGSNLGEGPSEPAAVLSSSAVLPLTPQPVLKPTITRSEVGPSAREMHVWKGLLVAEHSAAVFDGWTTRRSLQSGN